jgi:hypothetical protein
MDAALDLLTNSTMHSNVAILSLIAFAAGVVAAPVAIVSHSAVIGPIHVNARAVPATSHVIDDPNTVDRRGKPVIEAIVDDPTSVDRRAAPAINELAHDPTSVDRRAAPVAGLKIDNPTTVDRRAEPAANGVAANTFLVDVESSRRAAPAIEAELQNLKEVRN